MENHGRVEIEPITLDDLRRETPPLYPRNYGDSQLHLNLKSVYLACHFVLSIMREQKDGRIVSVSSIAGLPYIGKPQVAYNATKAAIIHLLKSTCSSLCSR
ncbi:uncharacterized protein A1O9_11293 [Exophiala aquamarina CBS 119918]|uniref:3-oxoacyl-[acyl-carrier protein] reductase n=1 Tax=Exophiala aquamarina CBS 119918 TaxID=1182545 RepID=A0A072PBE5_9EURO|nr:uncharacterized protein A1O9_11293 [Exophiala aquamarina CBS 119918]KEF52875.1 hypothetical protein A1O9_11293 [Exophiala aquamarina CBS 119918]